MIMNKEDELAEARCVAGSLAICLKDASLAKTWSDLRLCLESAESDVQNVTDLIGMLLEECYEDNWGEKTGDLSGVAQPLNEGRDAIPRSRKTKKRKGNK